MKKTTKTTTKIPETPKHRTVLEKNEFIIGSKQTFCLSPKNMINITIIKKALKKMKYDDEEIERSIQQLPSITPYLWSVVKGYSVSNEIILLSNQQNLGRTEELITLLENSFNCKEIHDRKIIKVGPMDVIKIILTKKL